jgi:hypothetical protein
MRKTFRTARVPEGAAAVQKEAGYFRRLFAV